MNGQSSSWCWHGRWWMSIYGAFHLFPRGFDPNEEWTGAGYGMVWLPVIGTLHLVPVPEAGPESELDEYWEEVAI